MAHANGTDASGAAWRDAAQGLVVAIVGGSPSAVALIRALTETEDVTVAAVCAAAETPCARLASELGIYTTRDLSEIFQVPELGLVIDASADAVVREELRTQRPEGLEVMGASGLELLLDLLEARRRGQEREQLYVQLQIAYDKIRSHEISLQRNKVALERSNAQLEARLDEITSTHEFFRALASYISVDDVCSLVVDGCNGILGAEVSCVYLLSRGDWTMRLSASLGRPDSAFRESVPVYETILGQAFREGMVYEPRVTCPSPSTDWLSGECPLRSQAAVALRAGEEVIGILVMGFEAPRELSDAELERFAVLGHQSSLTLENALLHAELERQSVTDRLTELYNHGHLKQRLDEEFKRAARFGHPLSLIMLDLDDFKAFNDTFGHMRGDVLLRAVSDVIRANLRSMDLAARYGGEEFVVVLPETDADGSALVAERIREGVEALRLEGPESAPVLKTVSAGVATFPNDAASALRLLESADAAMYRAKREGKNRVARAGS